MRRIGRSPPVPVNTPLIFEPPLTATAGDPASLGRRERRAATATSTQWGGANVYVSVDNVTYSQIAVITSPLRQGVLTASLPAAAGWDTTDTLAVDSAESGATLTGTSQAAAQQGATVSLVDSELLAFETATLTGTDDLRSDRPRAGAERHDGSLSFDRGAVRPPRRRRGQIRSADEPHRRRRSISSFRASTSSAADSRICRPATVYTFTPSGTVEPSDRGAARDRDRARSRPGHRRADARRRFRLGLGRPRQRGDRPRPGGDLAPSDRGAAARPHQPAQSRQHDDLPDCLRRFRLGRRRRR